MLRPARIKGAAMMTLTPCLGLTTSPSKLTPYRQQAWRADVDRVSQENARRRARGELSIRVGLPEAVDLRQP